MKTRIRRAAAALSACVIGAGLAIGAGMSASAHNFVVSTTPEDGATLTELPERFDITTNDVLLDLGGGDGFGFQIVGPDGLYYGDGCFAVEGPSLSADAALGEPGDYTIIWQAISADSHTISGEINFAWAPEGDWQADQGRTNPPVCGEPVVEEPAPSPTPVTTPDATPDVEPEAPEDAIESDDDSTGPATAWIVAGVVVVALIVAIILIALRRRGRTDE